MPRPKPRLRGIPHLVGALVAVPFIWLLLDSIRNEDFVIAGQIYGASLLALLTTSATYHTPYWSKPIRARLRSVDHAMIYTLIGGSYVPFIVVLDQNVPSWLPHVVGVGCGVGVLQSIFWAGAPRAMRTAAYLVLGYVATTLVPAMYQHLGMDVVVLVLTGGLLYTIGAVVYAKRYPNPNPLVFGYHEVFHCLVNLAAVCHYAAIWCILVEAS